MNKDEKIYSVTIYGKRYFIKKYHIFIIRNIKYIFLGKLKDEIPYFNYIYINDENQVIIHNSSPFKNKINFTIKGQPHGKGRPRFRKFGKFVTTYTDAKTVKAEDYVRKSFKKITKMKHPAESPVSIDIDYCMQIPKSLSKKKKESLNNTIHSKKPDLDNLLKTVLDGLNGYAYRDDSLIYEIKARKYYNKEPKIVVNMEW